MLTPQQSALRKSCGLPPADSMRVTPDPDDPAARELTTAQAATAAHVSEDTIRDWARRELLARVQASPADAPRYREADVLQVEASTRRGPRYRRLVEEAARDARA